MKRLPQILLASLAAVGAVSWMGCKPATQDEEAKVTPEVVVQVAKVTRTTLRAHVESYGSVEPAPAGGDKPGGAARLMAPVAGVMMTVSAKEGEHVEAGTIIAKLDDRAAQAQLRLAEQHMERQIKLKATGGTSEKAVQEAEQQLAAAKAQLALVQLSSPLAGTVARINVQLGQAVDLNTVVAEIVDLNHLVFSATIPAHEAAAVKIGQNAEIVADNAGNLITTGSVGFVSPTVDAKTGTVLVRVNVAKDSGLRPGQFARVRIVTVERADRLAVPLESMVTDVEGHSIIALVDGDKATQKPVKGGVRDGGLVEIDGEGVKEGDTVVTVGAYGLPKESKVRVVKPE